MAKVPSSVKDRVQKFLNMVSRRYYIQSAYLYGSQAKGTAASWSDIDVAIVSSDFSDDLFEERVTLMHIAASIDDRIEPYLFTEETFNEGDPLASDIKRHGLRMT